MQHGGLAVIQRRQAAIDGGGEVVRLGDAFTVGAKGASHGGEIPPLALTARSQSANTPAAIYGWSLRELQIHLRP